MFFCSRIRLLRLIFFLTGLLFTVLIASGCRSAAPAKPEVREFDLKGRVESIDLAKKRATITHEEIKGYMKGMTMGFQVPDDQALKSLKSGDRIEARLIFDSRTNLSWLENIRQISDQLPEQPNAGSGN